ncbi:hypothetical protein DID80_05460 [Candidatus Marinamargulisbacteria bacterium SCGC AAA071-K20]|nr:hypothetical protein DID80_05460 [Candidatus Marinamargulisbacteria bacterium SCGC AAA071-K20]
MGIHGISNSFNSSSVAQEAAVRALDSEINPLCRFISAQPLAALASVSAVVLLAASKFVFKKTLVQTFMPIINPLFRHLVKPVICETALNSIRQLIDKEPNVNFHNCILPVRVVAQGANVPQLVKAEIEHFVDNNMMFIQSGNFDGIYKIGSRNGHDVLGPCRYFDEFRRDLFGEYIGFPKVCPTAENKQNIWNNAVLPSSIVTRQDISDAWVLTKQDALDHGLSRAKELLLTQEAFNTVNISLEGVMSAEEFKRVLLSLNSEFPDSWTGDQKRQFKTDVLESYNDILYTFLKELTAGTKRSDGVQSDQCGMDIMSGAKRAVLDVKNESSTGGPIHFEDWIKREIARIKEDHAEAYYFSKFRNLRENRRLQERYFAFVSTFELGIRNKYAQTRGPNDGNGFSEDEIKSFIRSHCTITRMSQKIAERMTDLLSKSIDFVYRGDDKEEGNRLRNAYYTYIQEQPKIFNRMGCSRIEAAFGVDIEGTDPTMARQVRVDPSLVTSFLNHFDLTQEPILEEYNSASKILIKLREGSLGLKDFADIFPNLTDVLPKYSWAKVVQNIAPTNTQGEYIDFQEGVISLITNGKLRFRDLNITTENMLSYRLVFHSLLNSKHYSDEVSTFLKSFAIGVPADKLSTLGVLLYSLTQGSQLVRSKTLHSLAKGRQAFYRTPQKCTLALKLLASYSSLSSKTDKLLIANEVVHLLTSTTPVITDERDKKSIQTILQQCLRGADADVKSVLAEGMIHLNRKCQSILGDTFMSQLTLLCEHSSTVQIQRYVSHYQQPLRQHLQRCLDPVISQSKYKALTDMKILVKSFCTNTTGIAPLCSVFLSTPELSGINYFIDNISQYTDVEKNIIVQGLFGNAAFHPIHTVEIDQLLKLSQAILMGMSEDDLRAGRAIVSTLVTFVSSHTDRPLATNCMDALLRGENRDLSRILLYNQLDVLLSSNGEMHGRLQSLVQEEYNILREQRGFIKDLSKSNSWWFGRVSPSNIRRLFASNRAALAVPSLVQKVKIYLLYLRDAGHPRKFEAVRTAARQYILNFRA